LHIHIHNLIINRWQRAFCTNNNFGRGTRIEGRKKETRYQGGIRDNNPLPYDHGGCMAIKLLARRSTLGIVTNPIYAIRAETPLTTSLMCAQLNCQLCFEMASSLSLVLLFFSRLHGY